MPEIPRHIIEQIRESADIVEVVGQHVKLQRAGNRFKGRCPFHQEKTPSFHVVPHLGIYHCFGCQASGDVFKFLQQIEGLSFVEAVQELARSCGIEVEQRELSPSEAAAIRQRATLQDVLEAAATFFENVLWTRPEGQPARDYLQRRGMSPDTARDSRMGFAPDRWTGLLDHLHSQGFTQDMALQTGLAKARSSGDGGYDAFRNRVMFPIRDDRGKVIAFGGRLLEGEGPKYINTPETAFYDKSKTLYGLYTARRTIQQRDRVLVVEGYFDVLSMHQVGITETVATCGTSLTEHHMQRLRRHTRNVIVVMDGDAAGQRAAQRTLPLFLSAGILPHRLELPEGKDPDDVAREGGIEAVEAVIRTREPLLEWVIQRKLDANGRHAAGRLRTLEEMEGSLVGLPNALIAGVASSLGIDEKIVRERVQRQHRQGQPEVPAPQARSGWSSDLETNHLLWLLIHRRDKALPVLMEVDRPGLLPPPVHRAVGQLIDGTALPSILDDEPDPGVHRVLIFLAAKKELYTEEQAAFAMCEVLTRRALPHWERRRAELEREIALAGNESDWARYRTASYEKKAIEDWLEALTRALVGEVTGELVTLLRDGPALPEGA